MNKKEIKYYTPEIEEFHVGFEYERNEPHRIYYKENSPTEYKWVYHKWDESQIKIGKLRYEIFEKNIRVKLLDSEDIMDLGCVKDKKEPTKFDFILGTKFTLDNYNLYLADVTGRVIITANDLTRAYDYNIGPKKIPFLTVKLKTKVS